GVLCLLRENTLLVVPCLGALALRERRFKPLAVFALGVALCLLPAALHNGLVGGSFLPTTFQGGVNFWIGNHAGADGTYQPVVPGKQIPAYERSESVRLAEQAVGHPLTPGQVSRWWLSQALSWARSQPRAFLALQL